MKLMNTPHLSAQGQGVNPTSGDLLANLGGNLQLDPETLKLLEQSSVESGVDFTKVLEATEKGQDPEAVLELLKSQKSLETETANQIISGKDLNIAEKALNQPAVTKLNSKSQDRALSNILGQKELKSQLETAHISKQNKVALDSSDQTAKQVATETLPISNRLPQVFGKKNANAPVAAVNMQSTKSPARKALNNKLVNLDEFVAKQSPSMKTNIAKKAYKPVSESMFNKKIESSLPAVASIKAEKTNLQEIMFGQGESSSDGNFGETNPEMANFRNTEVSDVRNTTKVFDINSLSKNDSTNEVIAKVQDYIIQTKAGNNSEVEVSFQHEELGKVDLLVQKEAGDQVKLVIGTNTKEASRFFNQNQKELLSTLNSSGIQIADFKLESSNIMNSSNSSSSSHDGSPREQFARGNGQQHNSESGQRDQESRKRSELWDQFNKEAA